VQEAIVEVTNQVTTAVTTMVTLLQQETSTSDDKDKKTDILVTDTSCKP
jgi:hypothetical protein